MSRAEDVVMRLYEDASLRGDLTDEPADRLLKWAEEKLIALDETAADDAAFEAGTEEILGAIRQINRTVGITLSISDTAGFNAQSAPDEMALVESLIAGIDDNMSTSEDALAATASAAEADAEMLTAPPDEAAPELPQLNIALNPALTSFFTGQPSPPVEPDPSREQNDEDPPDEPPEPSSAVLSTPEEPLPHLDIVVNPALTGFFTGQPAPAEDDNEAETDDDDAQE